MDNLERSIRALILVQLRELDSPEQVRILGSVGFKPAEIAEMLGIKADTVKKNLQRHKGGKNAQKTAKTV
jgi:DNA-directed RNA polymerase specialized sigma24 family protein